MPNWFEKTRERIAGAAAAQPRIAVPHTFQPVLSVTDALLAVFGVATRIILGCVLFAVCGAYTLLAWSRIETLPLRIAAVSGMAILFAALMTALMLGISAIGRLCRQLASRKTSN